MHAKLFGKSGKFTGQLFIITDESDIGRSPDNLIQLSSGIISNRHARIYYDKKQQCYFIEDLNSKNGTSVDKMPVNGRERLDKTHVITFAKIFDFIFSASDRPVHVEQETQPIYKKTGELLLKTKPLDKEPIFSIPEFLKKSASED